MAGWTITNWTGDPDWSAVANINDFEDAIAERVTVKLGPGLPARPFSVGDDVQAAVYLFKTWQERVELCFGPAALWARSHDNGIIRSVDYYDNAASIDTCGSLAEGFAATDLANTNWRRYTTHPDDGGSDLGGQCQVGDIIGPWLFEDIQKVLNILVWTVRLTDWVLADCELYDGTGDDASWAAAKAAAAADWDGPASCGACPVSPRAWSNGLLNAGVYTAAIGRMRSPAQTQDSISTLFARDIRWHAYCTKNGYGTWNDHGDLVAENGWECWSVDSPSEAAAEPTSLARMGSTDLITAWPAQPNGGATSTGWAAQNDDNRCLILWDVTNGFTYH